MLTIMPVVRGKHFPELFGELVLSACGVRVMFAPLVVPDAESHSAAVAEFKGFDRICRILCNFLVQDSYGTIQITCHVILRWVEDSLANESLFFRVGLPLESKFVAQHVAGQSQDLEWSTGESLSRKT
jgi:hypothetical protein